MGSADPSAFRLGEFSELLLEAFFVFVAIDPPRHDFKLIVFITFF
jgi:hypothetical protein